MSALLSMRTSVIIYKYLPWLVVKANPKAHAASVLYQKGLSSSLQLIHTLIYLITQSRGQELIYIFNSSFHPWQRKKEEKRWQKKERMRREKKQCRWIPLKKNLKKLWISQKLRNECLKKINKCSTFLISFRFFSGCYYDVWNIHMIWIFVKHYKSSMIQNEFSHRKFNSTFIHYC